MQEQIISQLAQVLQERVNLSPEQSQQVAQVAFEFVRDNLPQLIQNLQGGEGGLQLPGGLGGLFGGGNQ